MACWRNDGGAMELCRDREWRVHHVGTRPREFFLTTRFMKRIDTADQSLMAQYVL